MNEMQNYRQRDLHPSRGDIIYGIHPVLEALEAGKEIEKILVLRNSKNIQLRELNRLATGHKVPVQQVPPEKLDGLVHGNHQGVVAFVSPIDYQPIENVLMSIYEKRETPLLLMLDRVTDVRNLGAIARSAECAGVHALVVPSRGSALINADAVKTSAGALNNIPVHRSPNLKDTIRYLKDSGLTIAAVTEYGDQEYFRTGLSGPLLLILGSEEDGISPEYLKLADVKVRIPLKGATGSLNVSVAAGIIIFEALRQRQNES